MAAKKQTSKKDTKLVAYAPFEWDDKEYKEGDVFSVPSGYVRDTEYEEFRNLDTRRGDLGIPFYYEVEIMKQRNPETNKMEPVMDHRRVVFPLVEKGVTAPEGA